MNYNKIKQKEHTNGALENYHKKLQAKLTKQFIFKCD